MNLSLPSSRVREHPISETRSQALSQALSHAGSQAGWVVDDDAGRLRQLRALLSLLVLYAAALLFVILLSDGADIGCILTGIGGHVLYASGKTALAWREASWLEAARARVLLRRRAV